ncbi:MAG TPA: alpha-glucosidase C-terminal domain-containing protein, partial [Polyangia bacterium]
RSHPALVEGARQVLHLDAASGTYAYLRAADPAHPVLGDVLAAFNLSPQPRTISVRLPGFSGSDLLNGQAVRVSGNQFEVSLAPMSGAFIA